MRSDILHNRSKTRKKMWESPQIIFLNRQDIHSGANASKPEGIQFTDDTGCGVTGTRYQMGAGMYIYVDACFSGMCYVNVAFMAYLTGQGLSPVNSGICS